MISSAWGMLRPGARAAPSVPWTQWSGQRTCVPYGSWTVSNGFLPGWEEANDTCPGVCQSWVRTTFRKAGAMRLMIGTISSPPFTASEPPGMKQFWTSTTRSTSCPPGLIVASAPAAEARPTRPARVRPPAVTLRNSRRLDVVMSASRAAPDRRAPPTAWWPSIVRNAASEPDDRPPVSRRCRSSVRRVGELVADDCSCRVPGRRPARRAPIQSGERDRRRRTRDLRRPYGLLLDRTDSPGVGPDRTDERPVLFELHGFGPAPLQHLGPGLVRRVVEQIGQKADRDEVLPLFLPGFGHLHRTNGDVLQPVDAASRLELVAFLLQGRAHLGRQSVPYGSHIPRHPGGLDFEEEVRRGVGEAHRIERPVHLADMPEPAIQVARRRRPREGGGGRGRGLGPPGRGVGALGRRVPLRACRRPLLTPPGVRERGIRQPRDDQDFHEADPAAKPAPDPPEEQPANQPP